MMVGKGLAVEVRVVVVDDHAPFRQAARAVCAKTPGFVVVGEAATGEEAIDVAADTVPDLVLMDINLPGLSGIEASRRIRMQAPGTLVVLISTYGAEDLPLTANGSAADGYLHKEVLSPQLLSDIWSDRRHPAWFS